jgi:hypothetical protein
MTAALLLLLLLDPASASAAPTHVCQQAAEAALRGDPSLRAEFWRIRVELAGGLVESDPAGGHAASGRATLFGHDGAPVGRSFVCEIDDQGRAARFALGR